MAAHGLLLLLDDIAVLLDDVATLSKVAAKKTAGVLGDDLALNAQQVSGTHADRELPVVWAVAKGSFINKLILVPAALFISATIPSLITPLLMIGGLFLCYEGAEAIIQAIFYRHRKAEKREVLLSAVNDQSIDMVAFEQQKIKGAIRTDFILSAEIIAITLGVVSDATLSTQAGVLTLLAIVITVIVYGLVAAIVRLDDWGLLLLKAQGLTLFARIKRDVGYSILQIVPYLMKTLSIVGTAAMFLVGGGILSHGIPLFHLWSVHISAFLAQSYPLLSTASSIIFDGLIGVIAGLCLVLLIDYIIKPIVASLK